MKIEELKHNHSLTDLLKILLFTILMLAPIGMVATRCLYVIANKNAYQSYSGTTKQNIATPKYTTNEVETWNDFEVGNYYVFEWTTTKTNTNTEHIIFEDIGKDCFEYISYWSNYMNSYEIANNDNNIDYLSLYTTTDTNRMLAFDSISDTGSYVDNNEINNNTINNQILIKCIDQLESNVGITNEINTYITNDLSNFQNYNVETIESSTLDNVFEYSVSQLEESSIFNWTENTAIFSGINAMNVQLGINSPAITIVLTYWLILTCIYVIIDIVLKLFTYLTHMIGSRKS